VRRLYEQILEAGDCLSLRDLAVSGDDLIAAGMQPGKELGRVLQDMLRDVVDVPAHNDRDYLLQRYLPS
jgi:tRNA nucleotidyltransferase (CCA-adding enzyme)